MDYCNSCDIVHDIPAGCPLCELEGVVAEHEGTIEDLNNEIDSLKDEISTMEG